MALFAVTSCNGGHDQKGVIEVIQNTVTPFKTDIISEAVINKSLVAVHDSAVNRELFVRDRVTEINRFNCDACHATPLSPQTSQNKLTHADINLAHGSGKGPDKCDICHAPDNRSKLKTVGGKLIGFNEVYQLCGDCHFQQKNDWIGGAHGKVVGSWEGARVRYNCADCHNPHQPGFPKRWPATYSLPDQDILSISTEKLIKSSNRSNQGY